MKRIFISFLLLISLISTMEAKAPFTLNAGKNQTIILGDSITLNGKITSGKKSQIEYYQWTEKAKVLHNTFGDEILYNDASNAENGYTPARVGEHLLRFQAMAHNGEIYEDTLLIIVKNHNDNNDLIIDAGSDTTINLGEFITLKGVVKKGKIDGNVYSWEENDKLIINMAGDEILTVDYEERENHYKPTTIGKHQLTFHVESENGKVYSDTLILTVKKKGSINEPISREELISMINSNKDVRKVNTSKITNMSRLFSGNANFNQDISSWDTSNVTNMSFMFAAVPSRYRPSVHAFNQDISNWNVSNVNNMSSMFLNASKFNQAIGSWNVSKVINMNAMFSGAKAFNQNIGSWNVAKVNDMGSMFLNAKLFNQNINSWNVAGVRNMNSMFFRAEVFNQNITSWNVSNVVYMRNMFYYAKTFNHNVNTWDVGKVKDMHGMFSGATTFNKDIGSWNVSNVTDMEFMFLSAIAFNQNISSWNVSKVHRYLKIFKDANAMEDKNKPEKFK